MFKNIKNVKTSTNKLAVMQNKCFCTMARVFRVIMVLILEAKTYIAPINMHLDRLQAKDYLCLHVEGQEKLIKNLC